MTALVAVAAIVTLGGLTAWAFWLAPRADTELLRAIRDLCAELRAARKDLQ